MKLLEAQIYCDTANLIEPPTWRIAIGAGTDKSSPLDSHNLLEWRESQ